MAVRNNGGGYFNHTFYWESMKAKEGACLPVNFLKLLLQHLVPFEEFKKLFSDAGKTRLAVAGHGSVLMIKGTCLLFNTKPG